MRTGLTLSVLFLLSLAASADDPKPAGKTPAFEQFKLIPDKPPTSEALTEILHEVGKKSKEARRVEVPFDVIAPPVDMVGSEDFTAFAAGPVLVITGDRDAYAPLDRLRATLEVRPDARLEIVDGADHFFSATGTSAITEHVMAHVPGWL